MLALEKVIIGIGVAVTVMMAPEAPKRSGIGRGNPSMLCKSPQLVKQHTPECIALREITFLMGPAFMCERQMNAAIRGFAEIEGDTGAH
jgi:hypothetical protein